MGVFVNVLTLGIGLDDFRNGFFAKVVLILAFNKVLAGINEENIFCSPILLQYQNDRRNTGTVEKVGRQANDGIDAILFDQCLPDFSLGSSAEQHAVRQHNSHRTSVIQMIQAVQHESIISLRGRRQFTVFTEPRIL